MKHQENTSATGILGKELRRHLFQYCFCSFTYLFLNTSIS